MGVYDWMKDVLKIAQTANRMDLYEKITDLMTQVTELREERIVLKSQVDALQSKLKLRDDYTFDKSKNTYWKEMEGAAPEGPFCPKCMNTISKAVPMGWLEDTQQHFCSVCKFVDAVPTLTVPNHIRDSSPANKRVF